MTARALALRAGLLAALYIVIARLALLLHAESGFAGLVWPPTGIALAALLIYGYRLWPGIAVGAFVANAWVGASVPVALGIATGNTLEAVVAVYCLRRVGFQRSLGRLRDVAALTVLAAVASTTISASIGVTSLWLGDRIVPGQLGLTWLAWWWGDLGGALIVAPVLLVWSVEAPPSAITPPSRIEAIVVAGSIVVFGALLFGGQLPRVVERDVMIVPLLIWAAVRFGPRGAASAATVITAMR